MKNHPILDSAKKRGMNLGLQQFKNYVEYALKSTLGIPCIQVAGTNGKGSVCQALCNIYDFGDYQCGLFTSPHLEHINERIRINDLQISNEDLDRLLYRVEKTAIVWAQSQEITVLEENPLTYFEIMTAVALFYFEEHSVDIAVYEVGLGGRLDATSVVTPVLSIVTSISFDHMNYLGDDIPSIAYEKGAIIRSETPVVTGNLTDEAFRVIRLLAEERNAPIYRFGEDYTVNDGDEIFVKFHEHKLVLYPQLKGEHQKQNMSIASVATLLLQQQFPVSQTIIEEGIANCTHPGRLEELHPNVLLDCAHNEGGAKALKIFLEKRITEGRSKPILIFGASSDKDTRKIIIELSSVVSEILTTHSDHHRAIDCNTLADEISFLPNQVLPIRSLQNLLTRVKNYLHEGHDIVCCGSIYLVGYLRPLLIQLIEELDKTDT